jgi:hypothetical protein
MELLQAVSHLGWPYLDAWQVCVIAAVGWPLVVDPFIDGVGTIARALVAWRRS